MLYLGNHTKTQQPIKLSLNALNQHAAVMGMTGSGKTGLLLAITEDLIENNIPVILIDIKGDMANIAMESQLKDKINLRVLTPGATHGEAVNIFANMEEPDRYQNAVSTILKMIKEKDVDAMSSKHVYLSSILAENAKAKQEATLSSLIDQIIDPPFTTMGKMDVDVVVPNRTRQALAAKINNMIASPSFANWHLGMNLDIADLYTNKPGKTNVTIYSVAHLVQDDQRTFALSLVLDQVLAWMRKQPGSEALKAALVVDECVGLLPPYPANPPTKMPLLTLLKQARAFGLGMILSSQNPMDLDYKAMSNCGTWLIGRLQMKNDRERVLDAVTSTQAYSRIVLNDRITRLQPRQFMLVRSTACEDLSTRNVKCKLAGPLQAHEISALVAEYEKEAYEDFLV